MDVDAVVLFGVIDCVGLCSMIHPNFAGILIVVVLAELFACIIVIFHEQR